MQTHVNTLFHLYSNEDKFIERHLNKRKTFCHVMTVLQNHLFFFFFGHYKPHREEELKQM